ncbi:hypothetical protein DSO57_1024526 [Entomophthora muscae]|uniref:Uncharacterized protein n=1 Tax=Entomophthora muscae TaxID=34485 RepID=A0ACC2TDU5_9FUNG|nr:hypothetical protein DSO57_1024526 [Entomophthora muscae]
MGWVPNTVNTWLCTNKTTYEEIRKYFHPNIGPENTIIWKQRRFSPREAKLWEELIIDVSLAHTLQNRNILPVTIERFIERGYTLDKAIMYSMEGTSIDQAKPPQNSNHPRMSYSERVKRGKEPPISGPIPYEDFIRDHMSQGNPYKSMPKSYIKNTIRIYLNNLSGSSMRGYLQAIFTTLDAEFKDIEVDHKWSPEGRYINIGFPDLHTRDTAAKLEFIHNGTHLKVDITRYAHHKARCVTFSNLPTNKYSEWVREAIITGAAYYGTVLECREEGNFKAQCMHTNTLHILLDAVPIVRSMNTALPQFVRLPGCKSVIYVKLENARQVCHFCFAMRHNTNQCHIKKGVHIRDYEIDVEKGITKAIQCSLDERHRADKEQDEELTNSEETGDFLDPSVPDKVRMNNGTDTTDQVIHPDFREWQKSQEASNKTQKKTPSKKPAPQSSSQPQNHPSPQGIHNQRS